MSTVYGYARVSTAGQAKDGNSLEAQERDLRAEGATVIFKEHFTGTKTDRPKFSELLQTVKPGDKIIVTKLDRFARTATQGMETIKQLQDKGVTVQVLNMGTIDNTPMGKVIAQVILAFAEFERDMIVERTQTGKAIAKASAEANGEKFNEGRPPVDADRIEYALSLLDKMPYSEVVKKTGISKSTLIRYKKKRDAQA